MTERPKVLPQPTTKPELDLEGRPRTNIFDERLPQLSPLYKHIPNAKVDEFGTITMLPYWRVARGMTICGIKYCRNCSDTRFYQVSKEGRKVCRTCQHDLTDDP